jgi:hypothetical protein
MAALPGSLPARTKELFAAGDEVGDTRGGRTVD